VLVHLWVVHAIVITGEIELDKVQFLEKMIDLPFGQISAGTLNCQYHLVYPERDADHCLRLVLLPYRSSPMDYGGVLQMGTSEWFTQVVLN
jgi:hypothetical protein